MNAGRWLRIFTLAAFAVCCGLICVGAQQARKQGAKTKPGVAKQDGADPGQIKQVTVNVRLPVTVTDKNHRFIVDLKESDFEIAEDKTPQAIVSFLPQSDLPLDLAALMDTSNSVKPKLKFEKDAALTFLETMLNSRQDRALLATFDSQVELRQDRKSTRLNSSHVRISYAVFCLKKKKKKNKTKKKKNKKNNKKNKKKKKNEK